MVRMKDEDLVHGAGKDRVDVIILGRHSKAHMEEILRIGQVDSVFALWGPVLGLMQKKSGSKPFLTVLAPFSSSAHPN